MRFVSLLALPLVTALSVAACTTSSSAGGSSEASASCEKFYDAFSSILKTCEVAGTTTSFSAAARANYIKSCRAGLAAPGTSLTAASLDGCTSAISGATTCSGLAIVLETNEACKPRPGTLVVGAGCSDDAQCASGDCAPGSTVSLADAGAATDAGASTNKPSYCGICAPTVAEGGDCSTTRCGVGLKCGADKTCVKDVPLADGASCVTSKGSSLDCAKGSHCATTTSGGSVSGTCQKLPARDEACAKNSNLCGEDLACVGGKCTDPVGVGGDCPTGLECKSSLACTAKKCAAPGQAKVGEKCGFEVSSEGGVVTTTATVCAEGLRCSSGKNPVCVVPTPEGGACTGNAPSTCEEYLKCSNGTCQVEDANLCK